MVYEQETQIAIDTVMQAAQLCESIRSARGLNAIEKGDCSPVTIADFGAQAIICQQISHAFPDDPIVAEEDSALLRQSAQQPTLQRITEQVQALIPTATPERVLHWIDRGNGPIASRYWTLDPIDGTKGFLRGGQYAIALALIEEGDVKVGAMGCPAFPIPAEPSATGALFLAVRGQGTQLISLQSGRTYPVRLSRDRSAHRLTESIESSHGNLPLQRAIAQAVGLTQPPLAMDSQAKYGAVACGQACLYMRLPWTERPNYQENIWDHAPGAIVVEEAGGRVTDMDGQPLDYGASTKFVNNRGIIASTGELHDAVLAALKAHS